MRRGRAFSALRSAYKRRPAQLPPQRHVPAKQENAKKRKHCYPISRTPGWRYLDPSPCLTAAARLPLVSRQYFVNWQHLTGMRERSLLPHVTGYDTSACEYIRSCPTVGGCLCSAVLRHRAGCKAGSAVCRVISICTLAQKLRQIPVAANKCPQTIAARAVSCKSSQNTGMGWQCKC